ncbi:EBNA1BP2 [Cordylochernes scorpioides]|uniref:EBNA1BP2 n=1 Tax=Cordylochernes scorpioides TaxID=51811 RepID=A0ABY6LGG1_9ARAC|nr:EBNA1BP2 [Cordylochernes scorpioides]
METKDLVCAPVPETEDVIERGQVNPAFRQEMQYFRLAQAVIQEGLPRVGKAMLRPADYFAEMARPDKQMQKVRAKMLQKKKELEQAQKAREAREMRKYGKKIQQEVLRQKHQEKKATLENIKKYVKGKKKNLDFLNEKGGIKNRQGGISKKNKRLLKDKKFGFGGKKRGLKQNTAASYAEPYMENAFVIKTGITTQWQATDLAPKEMTVSDMRNRRHVQLFLTWSTNAAHPVSLEPLQGTISRAN